MSEGRERVRNPIPGTTNPEFEIRIYLPDAHAAERARLHATPSARHALRAALNVHADVQDF